MPRRRAAPPSPIKNSALARRCRHGHSTHDLGSCIVALDAEAYGYDGLDRLVSAAVIQGSYGYSYDASGNRTAMTVGGSSFPYSSDAASNRLLAIGGTPGWSYVHDANGSVIADGARQYAYDARGRRVRKSGPLGERQYHYDDVGRLLAESTPNGIHDREYIYLGELPVAAVADGALYHLDPDHLGTPRLATDGQGTAVWRWECGEPFGAQPPDEDPGRTGVCFVLNLRFPGQYHDQETQLHYNYFRDYDPATGRYVQSDPIGLAGGSSSYAYADNAPTLYIDPLGLLNPAKSASALGNAAISGFSAASGGLKLAIAAGLSPASATGVGALPPAALAAWGAWNLKSSASAWQRSQQQWKEARCEDWSQATWKNLYGLLPGGTHYDDPGEASGPLNYIQNQGWWKFLGNLGYF